MFNRQQGGQARGARRISAFREALLAHGHGEWAFHADGRHVRVAREAPLQLSSLNVAAAGSAQINGAAIAVDDDDDRSAGVWFELEAEGMTDDTTEVFALASSAC